MSKAYIKEITRCLDCGFVYKFKIGHGPIRLSCALTHSEVNYNDVPDDCPLPDFEGQNLNLKETISDG